MDENRFFKWLWRANAILLACAVLLAIFSFVRGEIRNLRYVPSEILANMETYSVTEEGETVLEARWRYGDLRKAGASNYAVPLYLLGDGEDPSSGRRTLRNFVFMGAGLENGTWLLPDNSRPILDYEFLTFGDDEQIGAILYEILDGDKVALYLSRLDGEGLKQIVSDVDRYVNHVIDGNHLMIFYVEAGKGHVAQIDLSSFVVTVSVELPQVEQ